MHERFSSWAGGEPRFPQGSWGDSAAQVDSERHARAAQAAHSRSG
jgi:hypothetical protein